MAVFFQRGVQVTRVAMKINDGRKIRRFRFMPPREKLASRICFDPNGFYCFRPYSVAPVILDSDDERTPLAAEQDTAKNDIHDRAKPKNSSFPFARST